MRIIFAILFALSAVSPAFAKPTIIATCGASKGQAFYFEGGIVAPGQGGWMNDGFKDGAITFIRDGKDYNIVFKDFTGTRNYKSEGVHVWLIKSDASSGTYLFLALNANQQAGFVESYLLRINDVGLGTVVWTSATVGALRSKNSVFTAQCK